jgi:hypothetical protein
VTDLGANNFFKSRDLANNASVLSAQYFAALQFEFNGTDMYWLQPSSGLADPKLNKLSLALPNAYQSIVAFGAFDNPRNLQVDTVNNLLLWTETVGVNWTIHRAGINGENESTWINNGQFFALYVP